MKDLISAHKAFTIAAEINQKARESELSKYTELLDGFIEHME